MSDPRHAGDVLQRLRDADPVDRASLSVRTRNHPAAQPAASRSMASGDRTAASRRHIAVPAGRLVAGALVMVVVAAAAAVVWLERSGPSQPVRLTRLRRPVPPRPSTCCGSG